MRVRPIIAAATILMLVAPAARSPVVEHALLVNRWLRSLLDLERRQIASNALTQRGVLR